MLLTNNLMHRRKDEALINATGNVERHTWIHFSIRFG